MRNDRRFYLVDPDGRLVNNKTCGELMQVRPGVSPDADRLTLAFPSGETVGGDVELGAAVETSFYGRPVTGRYVDGPWSDAISEHAGRPLRLVRTDEPGAAIDRVHVVSLISDGSLAALARRAGIEHVDGRRFRMTVELEGCEEHEEDSWIGGEVEVGEARIRVTGPVGRCVVTSRNPDTGESDLDTLGSPRGLPHATRGQVFRLRRLRRRAHGRHDPRRRLPRARALTRGIAPPRLAPILLNDLSSAAKKGVVTCVRHSRRSWEACSRRSGRSSTPTGTRTESSPRISVARSSTLNALGEVSELA